jgi:hypothetical protein
MRKFCGAFLLLALGISAALAFVQDRYLGNPLRWQLINLNLSVHTNVVNRNTRAVRYFLASDGWSTTNTAAELNALRASFAQWQAVSGTVLKFEEGGVLTPPVDVNRNDNTNILFWAKSSTVVNGGLDDISGRLGVTFTSFFADGSLAGADIAFNGVEYGWFTDFSDTNSELQFVEGTGLHEIGHFIGLTHSPVGSASMLWVGFQGIDNQVGLSSDDIAGARFVYMATNQVNARATLKGQVTKSGVGVLGAAVFLEESSSTNMIAGTVSRSGGNYEMNAVPPGNYQVRVSPLDSTSASYGLVSGPDISSEFNSADPNFLPSAPTFVTLSAGVTNTLNLTVANSAPAFRITHIRFPTANPGAYSWASLPTTLRPGQNNITIGVASPNLPTSGATFAISGNGITMGAPSFFPNAFGTGLNFISAVVSVATNATPGMRTFTVTQAGNVAHANGFVEILPSVPDYNFDGLDDRFQRKWFPLFTVTNAAPAADPDNDGFPNSSENVAGTNPTNAASILKIDSIKQDITGARVTWGSVPGKTYQLLFRSPVTNPSWTPVGTPALASTSTTNKLDPNGTSTNRFYRVQVLP